MERATIVVYIINIPSVEQIDRVYALYTLHAKRFEKAIITDYMFNVSIVEKAELVLIHPVPRT